MRGISSFQFQKPYYWEFHTVYCTSIYIFLFMSIHKQFSLRKFTKCRKTIHVRKKKWVGPVSVRIYIIFLTRSGHCFFHMWITDKKKRKKISFQNSTCNFLGHVKDIFITSYYYVIFKNIHEKDFESRRGSGGSIKLQRIFYNCIWIEIIVTRHY